MGSHTNFYFVILNLLRFKDELHRIILPRLQPLIKLLKTKSIVWEDYCEVVPSNKAIADELGFKVARTNSMLKQLFEKLYEDFYNNPLKIENVVHNVVIKLDWKQYEKIKKNPDALEVNSFSIELKLKEIPRIGEQIEFEAVPEGYYYKGVVNEIRHIFKGKTQYIEIHAHPFENAYYKWARLKREHQEHEKWLKINKIDYEIDDY